MGLNTGPTLPWSGVVRPQAVPGLSSCLEERRLTSSGHSIPVSPFEVDAVRLAEWAVAGHRTLVLCPPDPLAPLSALIAAAVHVADMTDFFARSGVASGSRRHVAVVTTDYHARGVYRGLGIRGQGSSVAPLRDVVRAATLGRDGTVRVLDSALDGAASWSTIFVRSIHDLRRVGRLDLVVVELPTDDPAALLDLKVPTVVLARDPADGVVLALAERALTFGWDQADVEARVGCNLPPRLARRATGAACRVVAVTDASVCENAGLFWQDIGPLVRASRRSAVAGELAREAFGLFHDLLGLALPTVQYEQLTAAVAVRLRAVAAAARLTDGDARDLYLPMIALELRDLAGALGPTPSKAGALRRLVAELLDSGEDVMLIARTADMARMYASNFAADTVLRRVRVVSLGALADEPPASAAILTGMAPTWARWVYRAGIANTLYILAYATAGQESTGPQFSEADAVRAVIALQQSRETWLARPSAKARTWSHLSGERVTIPDEDPAAPEPTVDVMASPPPPEIPPGLWDGRDWLTSLEPGAAGRSPGDAGDRVQRLDAIVAATKVTFDDGRWAVLDLDGSVTRFRAGSGSADPGYGVRQIRPGDQILFLDGDSQKDLLAKVLEVAGEIPALAVAAGWVGHWRRVLAASYGRFGSYERFATSLRDQGCSVQTQTVRLWVIGTTIGPEDADDVRRVGLVADDEALLSHHGEVVRAMRSLRGAHTKLGRRLSDLALQVGAAAAAGHLARDEVIDERSGLTVADFQDSLDLVTVRAREDLGDVPFAITGRLHEAGENDRG